MSRLGKNPLFDAEKERERLGIDVEAGTKRNGRPRNEELVRESGAQQGLKADTTRATFIISVELLNKLKDYAYTERITIKDALEQALSEFLEDKNDLLPHNKR